MWLLMYQIVLFLVWITTIQQSHHRPMGLLMYQIVLFLVSIIIISLLIFESKLINQSDDNNNNNNSTIPSSTNGIVDVSDRPLPCVNNYHITFNIWIESYWSIQRRQQQEQFNNPIIGHFGFIDLFQLLLEPYDVLIIILFYFLLCLWCDSWSMISVFSHRFASCEYVNATNAHTCEPDIIIRSFWKEIFNTKVYKKELSCTTGL